MKKYFFKVVKLVIFIDFLMNFWFILTYLTLKKKNILRFFSQNIDILWHLINESGTLDIIHENI